MGILVYAKLADDKRLSVKFIHQVLKVIVPLCKGQKIVDVSPGFEVLHIMKLHLICSTCEPDDVMQALLCKSTS